MDTNSFRTRTIFMDRKHPSVSEKWIMGIDIGYSSVKVFAPNGYYSFPSYAIKVDSEQGKISEIKNTDIVFKNLLTNEIWYVGALAQNLIDSDDTSESINTLYNRHRYYSPMFNVIKSVGLALGMSKNEFGDPSGKPFYIQTGLPPKYITSDEEDLKNSFLGEYHFLLKIGNNPFKEYHFTINEENMAKIIPQPMGTLMSISMDQNGEMLPISNSYMSSNTLVFDPGFGTLDIYDIRNGVPFPPETFDTLGMKQVLKETSNMILAKFGKEIPVPAMQKYLETGTINVFNKKLMKSEFKEFDYILKEANEKVCAEAIEKIKNTYNFLIDYRYLIITGGTGAAWSPYIREHFKNMETLTIVAGNQNDDLPYIFSNVRGYYMYLRKKKELEK